MEIVVYLDQQMLTRKHSKIIKKGAPQKSTFVIMRTKGSYKALVKMKKNICWSAIGSDSQMLVYTQKLAAPGR